MLGQFQFLKFVCLIILLAGVPYALWCAGTGSFTFAIALVVVDVVAFIGLMMTRRAIKQIKEMKSPHIDKDIKPV